ncbi:MAG: hypothetical protein QOC95_243 [Thermoleophilaceae bacterium]|jgi:hypothetical protein|nr:hypothetical protein [Thermoleophilaceae bacterium]
MSDEQTVDQDHEERDEDKGESTGGDEQSKEAALAQKKGEEREAAKEKMKEFEDGEPPEALEDWPDDAAKYETYGGPDGGRSYEEGPEVKLGPSSLRHHADGKVSIAGEEVDNPDDYKGEPIPGGPTDPDSADDLTAQKIKKDQKGEASEGGDDEKEDKGSDDG